MTPDQARAQYNFLLTLCIRKAIRPVGFCFHQRTRPDALGLTPEEQFNLFVATAETFARGTEALYAQIGLPAKGARDSSHYEFFDRELARQLQHDIQRLKAELDLYSAAMRPERASPCRKVPQRIVVETDMPDYYLSIAQRAAAYYQEKYRLTKESKIAQHSPSTTQRAEPETMAVHKEFLVPAHRLSRRERARGMSCCRSTLRSADHPKISGRRPAHLVRQDRIFIPATL